MALTLAKGEAIVKEYEYSKAIAGKMKGLTTQSRLIVTNKRVIEEKTCYAKKNERIARSEIPLEKARKITTSFKRRGNALWLILAGVAALIMILGFALGADNDELMPMGVFGLLAAAAFILLFIFLRKSTVKVTIGTDTLMTPAMMFSSATKRRFFHAPQLDMYSETVKVILDAEVAIQMVDDLGATIMNAKEYVPGEAVSAEESAE